MGNDTKIVLSDESKTFYKKAKNEFKDLTTSKIKISSDKTESKKEKAKGLLISQLEESYNRRIVTLTDKSEKSPWKALKKALANVDAMEKATENLEEGEKDNVTYRQYLFKAIKDWQAQKAKIKEILDDKRAQDKNLQSFVKEAKLNMKSLSKELKAGKDVAREGKEFAKKYSVVTRKTLMNAVSGKNGTTGVLGSLKTAKNILDNYDKNPKKVKENEIKKGIDLLGKDGESKGYMKGKAKIYAGASMHVDILDTKMPKITGFNKIKQEAKKVCGKLVNLVQGKIWENVAAVAKFKQTFADQQRSILDALYGDCIEDIEYLEEEERDLAKTMVDQLFGLHLINAFEIPSGGAGVLTNLDYDEVFSDGELAITPSTGCSVFSGGGIADWAIYVIVGVIVLIIFIAYTAYKEHKKNKEGGTSGGGGGKKLSKKDRRELHEWEKEKKREKKSQLNAIWRIENGM